MTEQMQIPDPPKFSDAQLKKWRESGNFMPMLFEWYKFVGHLCIFFALIKQESPAVREFPQIQYSVLTGVDPVLPVDARQHSPVAQWSLR